MFSFHKTNSRNQIMGQIGALSLCAILTLMACQPARQAATSLAPITSGQAVAVQVTSQPLLAASACSGAFVTHKLPFATGTRLREINTYISNGSGVAVNDLDADGDLDLVFANIDGDNTILWNEGSLKFREEPLDDQFARSVTIVDVDGDGWLDITFTHRGLEVPSFWRNLGEGDRGTGGQGDKVTISQSPQDPNSPTFDFTQDKSRFVRTPLPGVDHYAYAMGWADLNGDGALDLVTGSYGAELIQHGIKEPEKDGKAGIVLYLRKGDRYVAQQLDPRSEALSVGLLDLNQDGRLDIWVANDFSLQDLVWLNHGAQWQVGKPFAVTSHSTMSIDWADIGNRGDLALLTTDMNPYDISARTMAAWLPMMTKTVQPHTASDPQLMANVLQVRDPSGAWQNRAPQVGLDASGWSWAGKFGDLDNDGWLDLYIVNGMIAADLFAHLDNDELVEENQAFRNDGEGLFEQAPEWKLGSTASGRGMVMADLDGDGDLDIVVNNLRGNAELHENQLCGGTGLTMALQWQGSGNHFAVGAMVIAHTSAGLVCRDLRASGGYLSGDAMQLHLGLAVGTTIEQIEIFWPDGAYSTVEEVAPGMHVSVVRD